MLSDYRLAKIEQAALLRRIERIRRHLESAPYTPPSREKLEQLQADLGVPESMMAELFGELWTQ